MGEHGKLDAHYYSQLHTRMMSLTEQAHHFNVKGKEGHHHMTTIDRPVDSSEHGFYDPLVHLTYIFLVILHVYVKTMLLIV